MVSVLIPFQEGLSESATIGVHYYSDNFVITEVHTKRRWQPGKRLQTKSVWSGNWAHSKEVSL